MGSETVEKGRQLFKCDICGFAYLDKSIATSCEKYCSTHGACSMEITKNAVKKSK